jgi:hypothetical protein
MPKSRLFLVPLWMLVGYLAPSACAVSDEEPVQEGACLVGPTCNTPDSGMAPSTTTLVDAATSDLADASVQGELCGVGSCLPEDVASCDDMQDAGQGAQLEAGASASSLDASAPGAPAASPSGADAGATLSDAAAPSVDGAPGFAASDAGVAPGEIQVLACQIVGTVDQPERRCLPAGSKAQSEPCDDASECAPGLTCIAESGEGRCLPYCCSGSDACAAGSYCAARPALRDGHARPAPVCVPADGCSLAESFPCAGDSCVCRSGTACTVVRRDGTTSCVAPGRGLDGDECPCAPGYFCSPASGTCLQICELTAASTASCVAGHCQMVAGFPEDWGLCVGATSER